MSRFEKAESAYQKAIACSPDHYAGHQGLAQLYLQTQSKPAQALALAKKAVRLRADARGYFILANANTVNGLSKEARIALKCAIELDPGNVKYQQAYENMSESSK